MLFLLPDNTLRTHHIITHSVTVYNCTILCEVTYYPWRTCTRVTVVVWSVCLSGISPHESVLVLKTLSHTQRAAKVKKSDVFSETAPLQRLSTLSLGWPCMWSSIFPVDNTYVHCASSQGLTM